MIVHEKPAQNFTFDRLEMLWEKYPQYHEKTLFTTLEDLLSEHESYRKDLEEDTGSETDNSWENGDEIETGSSLLDEYNANHYDEFLIQLSWSDLPYRYETAKLIRETGDISVNPYVKAFMEQFRDIDTDKKACFLFPESVVSQFFVIMEVCKRAESLCLIRNLFPDEDKAHYLAVFDKEDMDSVLLMFHLLYTNTSQDLYGGYSLYDYSLPWYQQHLRQGGTVLRSPYLPDRLATYQGSIPFYHNPAKTVYVRRNIAHILEAGYFHSELEFFISLIRDIMPVFQWWYMDLLMYEEKDGYKAEWRMERTRIRTKLTADGIIKPKWKHELSLFHAIRAQFPDTLYQYRPEWLGRQSLDLYIPSLRTAVEYQGIQHYLPIEFFGGEEALTLRKELDDRKRTLCAENDVRLIEWPYSVEPTLINVKQMMN